MVAVPLAACSGPAYVDRAGGEPNAVIEALGPVVFDASAELARTPPRCIAVMPFQSLVDDDEAAAGHAEDVRRTVYAQLAPRALRDVELAAIDTEIEAMSPSERRNYGLIGWRLGCDGLLYGVVTDHRERYLGLYSDIAVGAELELVRARDGAVLWRAEHVATARSGGLPISALGLVEGAVRAAANVLGFEQLDRVTEDLARRLVRALPALVPGAHEIADAANREVLRPRPDSLTTAAALVWRDAPQGPVSGPSRAD